MRIFILSAFLVKVLKSDNIQSQYVEVGRYVHIVYQKMKISGVKSKLSCYISR